MGWLENMLSNIAGKGATEVIDKSAKSGSAGNEGRQNGENPFNTLYERLQQRYNIKPKGQEESQPVQQEQAGYQPIAEEPRQRKGEKAGQAEQGRAYATGQPEEQESEKERKDTKRPVKALLSALAGGLGSAVANNPLIDVDSAIAEEVGNNTKKDEDEEPKPDVEADKSSKAEAKEITARQKAIEEEQAMASKMQARGLGKMAGKKAQEDILSSSDPMIQAAIQAHNDRVEKESAAEKAKNDARRKDEFTSMVDRSRSNLPTLNISGGTITEEDIERAVQQAGMNLRDVDLSTDEDIDLYRNNTMPQIEGHDFPLPQVPLVAKGDISDENMPTPFSSDIEPRDAIMYDMIANKGLTTESARWLSNIYDNPELLDTMNLSDEERSKVETFLDEYKPKVQPVKRDKTYGGMQEYKPLTDEQREKLVPQSLQDEIQAQQDAQALLLENPKSKGAWAEHNRLMSQGIGSYDREGNVVDGWKDYDYETGLVKDGTHVISADELENLTDNQLINLELLNNDKFRDAMAKKYGDDWLTQDAFLSDAMDLTGVDDYTQGEKRDMMNDIFFGTGDFEINPVIKAQLLQRVMNGNPDADIQQLLNPNRRKGLDEDAIAQMDEDALARVLETYYDNPIDLNDWFGWNSDTYQGERTVYNDEAALFGALLAVDPTIGLVPAGGLDYSDLDPNDLIAAAVLTNLANRDDYDQSSSMWDLAVLNNVLANGGYNTELRDAVYGQDKEGNPQLLRIKSPDTEQPFFPGGEDASLSDRYKRYSDGFTGDLASEHGTEGSGRNTQMHNIVEAILKSAEAKKQDPSAKSAAQLLNAREVAGSNGTDAYLDYLLSDYIEGLQGHYWDEDNKRAKRSFTTKRFTPENTEQAEGDGSEKAESSDKKE